MVNLPQKPMGQWITNFSKRLEQAREWQDWPLLPIVSEKAIEKFIKAVWQQGEIQNIFQSLVIAKAFRMSIWAATRPENLVFQTIWNISKAQLTGLLVRSIETTND